MKHICLIGIAAVLAVATGCRKTPPPPEPKPEPVAQADSPQANAAKLSQRIEQFSRDVAQLPGRDERENRQLMAARFGDLAEILPMLEGPEPSGAFRQQVRIIRNAQVTLQSAAMDVPVEPMVGLGLRAAENALSGIQARTFYAHEDIAKALEPLRTRIRELDTARGPLHQLVAAQAMREIANVLYRMQSVVYDRSQLAVPATQEGQ